METIGTVGRKMSKDQKHTGPKHDHGKMDFVKMAPLMGGISLVLTILAIAFILGKGFVYGIDFSGGTEMQVMFPKTVDAGALRETVHKLGIEQFSVQGFGGDSEYLIRNNTKKGLSDDQANAQIKNDVIKIKEALKAQYGLLEDGIRRVDTVGPQVGSELKNKGMLAAFYSFLVILIYVAFRFDYKYAPGAVLCLVHDSILTLGLFSMLGKEVNVQIMAAVLTLIGYSLNDTIVTFDRIRETAPQFKELGSRFIINRSINDMLVRTLLTSGSTFIATLVLYVLGGGVISEIAFTMCIGIVVGTYSSIYVAAPLILVMEKIKGFA